jgi:hypothetical protein
VLAFDSRSLCARAPSCLPKEARIPCPKQRLHVQHVSHKLAHAHREHDLLGWVIEGDAGAMAFTALSVIYRPHLRVQCSLACSARLVDAGGCRALPYWCPTGGRSSGSMPARPTPGKAPIAPRVHHHAHSPARTLAPHSAPAQHRRLPRCRPSMGPHVCPGAGASRRAGLTAMLQLPALITFTAQPDASRRCGGGVLLTECTNAAHAPNQLSGRSHGHFMHAKHIA